MADAQTHQDGLGIVPATFLSVANSKVRLDDIWTSSLLKAISAKQQWSAQYISKQQKDWGSRVDNNWAEEIWKLKAAVAWVKDKWRGEKAYGWHY